MSGPVILLFDADPNTQQFIQGTLINAGTQVAAASNFAEMIGLLERYVFDAVFVNIQSDELNREELIQEIHGRQRGAAVVFICDQKMFAWAVDAFRLGAADFLVKPVSLKSLTECLQRIIVRNQKLIALASSMAPAPAPAPPPPPAPFSPAVDQQLFEDILTYHSECLKLFLAMERENVYLEEQLSAASGEEKKDQPSSTEMLIVHGDNTVMETLQRFVNGEKRQITLSQVYTGGEVLDKFGQRRYDALTISKALPDLDGEMLAQSLKSQYPTMEIIVLYDWGTPQARSELLSNQEHGSAMFHLRQARDLQALLNELQDRRLQREEEKRFAKAFKERHESFLKRFAEMKVRIEDAMDG